MSTHTQRHRLLPPLLVVMALGALGARAGAPAPVTGRQAGTPKALDVESIRAIVGMEGTRQDGQLKFTVPQNDLDVRVDGFRIIPPMGLGSWIAFSPAPDGAIVMGDVVVQEAEIQPVQQALLAHGMTVTGLHNHFVREEQPVMYMHVGGEGAPSDLARGVRAIFDTVAELRGGDPAAAAAGSVPDTLDTARIASILGHEGRSSRGVYKVTIGRPDVNLQARGVQVTTFMGFNTWASWQGSPERAAVAGDFAMLEDEVAPVIEALVDHGIEVVAVHTHMTHERPQIFFLHYWGVGPAEELARGLRAALDRTGA